MIHNPCRRLFLWDSSGHLSQRFSACSAMRRSESIDLGPRLPSRPEPRWCWIAPYAIGFDGFRWHAQGLRLTDQSFKDFLLSRIIKTRGTKPSEAEPEADADWNEHVTREIGPHPELSDTQQKVIALGYGMRSERAKVPVRKTLLYYPLKCLRSDTDPDARPPQDQLIVLLNRQATVGKRNAAGSHQELS